MADTESSDELEGTAAARYAPLCFDREALPGKGKKGTNDTWSAPFTHRQE